MTEPNHEHGIGRHTHTIYHPRDTNFQGETFPKAPHTRSMWCDLSTRVTRTARLLAQFYQNTPTPTTATFLYNPQI